MLKGKKRIVPHAQKKSTRPDITKLAALECAFKVFIGGRRRRSKIRPWQRNGRRFMNRVNHHGRRILLRYSHLHREHVRFCLRKNSFLVALSGAIVGSLARTSLTEPVAVHQLKTVPLILAAILESD